VCHDDNGSFSAEEVYEKLEKGVDGEGLLESNIRAGLPRFESEKPTS
jgi:hypothetical protein